MTVLRRNPWRIVISLILGIVVAYAAIQWAQFFGFWIIEYVHPIKTISEWEALGFKREEIIHRSLQTDLYGTLSWVGICIAAGLSAVLFVWEGATRRKLLDMVYWVVLLTAIPLSLANYWSADQFVSRWIQAVLNIGIAFCGIVCLAQLFTFPARSTATKVIKAFVSFFLAMQAVFIPLAYSLLWFLNAQRAISVETARDFNPSWISALTGMAALGFSIFQYIKSNRPEEPEKPKIIKP